MTRLATAAIVPVWWLCGRLTATGPVGLVGQLVALVGFSAVVGIGARIADAIDRRRT